MVYVEVSGKTFSVKEKLKDFGLRWDPDRKVWKGRVHERVLEELRKLANRFAIELYEEEDEEEDFYADFYADRGRNRGWVRCWECGRLVPPGQATRDANGGWYCGC